MTVAAQGPAELVRMALVARRYYLDGMSKVDIAADLGMSRFRVARLLERTRTSGMVKIDISYPGIIDVELSSQLQEAYRLRHAVVANIPEEDDPASLVQPLGRTAADLLAEIVTADDVLGLAWARSVSALSSSLSQLAPCPVVQLTGALSMADGTDTAVELVRRVARVGLGPAYFFYAPMIVADAATRQALREQSEVARALEQVRRVTKAVVGVGLWGPGTSTVYDALDERERDALRELGVRAEISGVLVDTHGTPVESPLAERTMGMTAEQLRSIPEVIAIGYGASKAPAVAAALEGGLVTSLVTHTAMARALVRDGEGGPVPGDWADRAPDHADRRDGGHPGGS
jgi:DNA-binding transcriptional regulator LsrR (DeoR family)